ncbi:hypothetical protein Q31b_00860 [Novipirellula aureliae]|uniref:Uncharacterized protein n=1 Tax=Novipirellula aureliae TaxID=2527966 RepID=A0A5C6E8Q8_9BACT|nr:hypothetical protein [Novipirellula aureliae]TWU44915.1 hypothetical protein Q31b_00860 [Novipirellula aureliae]
MSKPPVKEFRMGLIKATIWENQTKHGVKYTTTLTRLFKNGESWVESSRFGRDDLPLISKVSDQAHTWIFSKQQGE